MSIPTKHDLLAALTHHQGHHNGITAEQLALRLDCTARFVRVLVSELRTDGIALCGQPSTGYYIAATPEELESTCKFLRSRAMHSLALESKLRNVALGELLGQLRVPT